MGWAATLAGTWFQLKREKTEHAFRRALRNAVWPGLFEAIGIVVLVLCGWSFFTGKTIYEDHEYQASVNAQLVAENLAKKFKDAQDNAEQRCEQANGKEIKRLKRQLNAKCYLPDRKLTDEQKATLFKEFQGLGKNFKTPTITLGCFNKEREACSFMLDIRQVLQHAGWTVLLDSTDGQWVQKTGWLTGGLTLWIGYKVFP